ncbi:MAG: hypothetical protein O2973_06970 [Gemmatimonadetes bacterium]|nr:hypothetical protein [Gemmatimonadota bacterium]
MTRPGTGAPGAQPSFNELSKLIVAEQKQSKAELAKALAGGPRKGKVGAFIAGFLVALNLVFWVVFPPARETQGDHRSSLEVERDLRLVLASAASDVDIWRSLHDGQMPPALADAGISDTTIVYVKVDAVVYELRGTERDVSLSYRSNVSITDFLDGGIPGR